MTDTFDQEQADDRLRALLDALRAADPSAVAAALDGAHPGEIAELLESLLPEDRRVVWERVAAAQAGEVITHLSEHVREQLIDELAPAAIVAAAGGLPPDDLADLLPELPEAVIQQLLHTMDEQERRRLEAVLSYPECAYHRAHRRA